MDRSLEGLCDSDYFSRMMENRDHWSGTNRTIRNSKPILMAWNHVSASQIENYLKCHRSWFFKSVQKIQEPQGGAQALGESFHLIMEKVPKGLDWPNRADTIATPEEWDKADALAKVALPLLPPEPPHKAIRREWQISMPTYEGGPTFVGYIDLAIPPGIGWPALLIPDNEAIVGDYKTLSDFRYMKTPEELAQSVQMMSYGKWAIEEWPSGLIGKDQPIPEHIRLLHLYARTKPPFNRQSIRHESAVVTPEQINTFWNKTLDTIREMQQTTGCTNHEDVEANGALTGHCEAYGGCGYRDRCGLARESNIKTLFQIGKKPTAPTPTQTQEDMSGSNIIAKIQAARAAAQAGNNSTPVAQIQEPQAQPVAATSTSSPASPVTKSEPKVSGPEQAKPSGPLHSLMKKIESQNKGWPTLGGVLAQTYAKERNITLTSSGVIPGTGEMQATRVDSLGELMKLAAQVTPAVVTGVVPPDAPPREQPVITKPGEAVADPEATPGESTEDDEEESATSADTVSSGNIPSAGSGTVETAPKKRGRPSREEMAAREAAAKAEFEARVNAEVEKRVAAGGSRVNFDAQERDQLWESERVALQAELDSVKKELHNTKATAQAMSNQLKSAGPSTDSGCTIYVDCFPMKGEAEVTDFFTWIQPIAMAVAESNGVKDWRLIDYKGKGLLATHIRELIRAEGLPRAMTIPTYAGGADIALEVLTPLAKRVIRKLS